MGAVYLAEDTRLGRRIALKVLPPRFADRVERRVRFEREAKAVATLNHPNIVTIHSVEQSGGTHFLTMELVEGEPLSSSIPRGGVDLDRFFGNALPLVDALRAAHEKGITHRDLKSDNIMVDREGRELTRYDSSPLLKNLPDLFHRPFRRKTGAETLLDELIETTRARYVCPYEVALCYIGIDDPDAALLWFERAYKARADCWIWGNIDPRPDDMRQDPRFRDLLRRVGPTFWRNDRMCPVRGSRHGSGNFSTTTDSNDYPPPRDGDGVISDRKFSTK